MFGYFTYIMTLFSHHHHHDNNRRLCNPIIANFITSSIHLLSSCKRMHGMFTILSIFPAFRVIMDVAFDYQTANIIVYISIFCPTLRACDGSFRSLHKAIYDGGKIGNFITIDGAFSRSFFLLVLLL